MGSALVLAAAMLGLAGLPHCAAMCGAACTAVTGGAGRSGAIGFHGARIAAYAAAGAIVAGGVGALAWAADASPALRPLWTLVHAAALALGFALLWRGRQPAWLERLGSGAGRAAPQAAVASGWQRLRGPARAGAAGALWVAWPCGLLQSALVVAALAPDVATGAAAMAAFAVTSAPGLVAAPWLWARARRLGPQAGVWATRAVGVLMIGASGWALGHGLWTQLGAYCTT